MDVQLVIDPDLPADACEVVDAWNAAPEARALAHAQLVAQPPVGFPLNPELVQQGLILLVGAAGAAAGAAATLTLEALKDAVKARLTEVFREKLARKPRIKVDTVRQPGGGLLLVVTEE